MSVRQGKERLTSADTPKLNSHHETLIMDRSCQIGKFSANEGLKLLHKISKLALPLIGSISTKNIAKGLTELFEVLDADDFVRLIRQLSSVCLIEGRKINDADLQDYAFIMELCGEVIKHNFGDFFSHMTDALKDIGPKEKGPA